MFLGVPLLQDQHEDCFSICSQESKGSEKKFKIQASEYEIEFGDLETDVEKDQLMVRRLNLWMHHVEQNYVPNLSDSDSEYDPNIDSDYESDVDSNVTQKYSVNMFDDTEVEEKELEEDGSESEEEDSKSEIEWVMVTDDRDDDSDDGDDSENVDSKVDSEVGEYTWSPFNCEGRYTCIGCALNRLIRNGLV